MNEQLQKINKFYDVMMEFLANYSLQIIGAVLIMVIGVIAAKYVHKITLRLLLKKNLDETVSKFTANLVRFLVIAMMAVLALGKLGISIAPFIAALGAISLTAGLALQGSVSNFAAGIVLIITKPFKIGDTITIHDVYGEVEDIKLAYTVLVNEDGEQITIPNKYMIGDILVNSFAFRIVEGSVGIAYDSDVTHAITTITQTLNQHKDINKENEAIVGIEKFNDSSIDIAYRYWAPTKSFFKTQYEVNLGIFNALQKENISIPFPQREVRMLQE
ncbi:mechanosensitive ion channel family protein [Sulfurimonas paralvinellae]|uniref:Mechanosensitive ion channel n=1 Tax=Sulfurimonas paralvinellae TaxID=317658 RepID=A0A7M1B7X2_9BACT|nr:mechanosensitive ion channel domain-containing protein [Sulfurimonas paralvinellae]QOP44822.1 mechanosensitive ion channel [Sulfurimonas paralvinellae]